MALALSHSLLFLCFVFFPNFAYSWHSSCYPSCFTCGNFSTAIKAPFTTTSDRVGPHHVIKCNGTNPGIQFYGQGPFYPLRSITYTPNIVTVQDVGLVDPSWGSGCSYLFDFMTPMAFRSLSHFDQMLLPELALYNCTMIEHDFSKEFLLQSQSYTPCVDYNFYYTRKLDDETLGLLPTGCLASAPPLFERNISFGEDNGNLSLLSVGFSHQLELRIECFNCQAIGGTCSINGAPWGSACRQGINMS